MHPEAYNGFLTAARAAGLPDDGRFKVLDIGGSNWNGTVHDLWPYAQFHILDIQAGPGVHTVADARDWEPNLLYDVVIATEVFEHVDGWERIIATAAKALDPTGWGTLISTCASTNRPEHGATGLPLPAEGEYYGNVDPDALRDALGAHFEAYDVTYRYPPGDAYAWAHTPRRPE